MITIPIYSCVEERLNKDEIPPCFFNKLETDDPVDVTDFSVDAFAKKVSNWRNKFKAGAF